MVRGDTNHGVEDLYDTEIIILIPSFIKSMKVILSILLSLSGINCGPIERELFTSNPQKAKINFSKIKINGVYLGLVEHNNRKGTRVYFLYPNGIALQYYLDEEQIINFNQKKITDTVSFIDKLYKVKQAGGYSIVGNRIQIQIFEFVNNGRFELCTYGGDILNDSSIFITSCKMKSNSNFCPVNFKLNFHQMPKPDSTNQLMSKSWYWKKNKLLF